MLERKASEENHNYRELERKILDFPNGFDFPLFKNIVSVHMRKSGITNPDEILNKEFKLEVNNEIPGLAGINESEPNNIKIYFNIHKILKQIYVLTMELRKRNIKIDFDIVDALFKKILFHEMVHSLGGVKNKFEIITKEELYSSVDEAITEYLSFIIWEEYMASSGSKVPNEVIKSYKNDSFRLNEKDVNLLWEFIFEIEDIEELDRAKLLQSFFWAHFNRYNVSSNEFISLLPESYRQLWIDFLQNKS